MQSASHRASGDPSTRSSDSLAQGDRTGVGHWKQSRFSWTEKTGNDLLNGLLRAGRQPPQSTRGLSSKDSLALVKTGGTPA